jgi:hypothetical protein
MATPVVLTTGARPIVPVESGGVPMTPVDTLGEPVTVVDTLGEPVVLINNDGTPAYLAYSAKTYLGGVAPYHWLDFINNRALYAGADVGNVTGATGYSFTRASAATYTNADGTIEHFESGQPRMKRTADSGHNLLTYSEQFDNAFWPKSNVTLTANQSTAPTGVTTADLLYPTTTGTNRRILVNMTTLGLVLPGAVYTMSLYVKTAGFQWLLTNAVDATNGNDTCWFDVVNGVTGTIGSDVISTSVTSVGDGWYRVTVTGTASESNNYFWIAAVDGDNNLTSTASGTSGIYIWGAQLNEGSSATAYVATTTTPVYALRRGDRGVLIEGSRTNLLLRSQEFDNASWTKSATTITANATTAPDGTLTADKLIEGSGGSFHTLSQSVTVGAASPLTFSIYAKAGERTFLYMQMDSGTAMPGDRFAFFNLATGAVGTTQANTTALIEALANGWYRCSITATADADGGSATCKLITAQDGSTINYSGDGASGIFIWQSDAQAAAFPSSPIVTVAASATRAADVLTYTAGVTYPLQLWSEFERAVDTGGQETVLQVDDGTSGQLAVIAVSSADVGRIQMTGGANAGSAFAGAIAVGAATKMAGRALLNDCRMAVAGALGTADTSADYPSTPNTMRVGVAASGALPSFGYIRRIAVIQGAGTDANLTAMTS